MGRPRPETLTMLAGVRRHCPAQQCVIAKDSRGICNAGALVPHCPCRELASRKPRPFAKAPQTAVHCRLRRLKVRCDLCIALAQRHKRDNGGLGRGQGIVFREGLVHRRHANTPSCGGCLPPAAAAVSTRCAQPTPGGGSPAGICRTRDGNLPRAYKRHDCPMPGRWWRCRTSCAGRS